MPGVGGVSGFGTGGASGADTGGSDQGGSDNGGAAGAVIDPGCQAGEKRCDDGECRAISPEFGCGDSVCQPCNVPPNSVVGCNLDTGSCQVQSCAPSFADCNGDVINDVGDLTGDGCEYSFGEIAVSGAVLDVPFASITLGDGGGRGDWTTVPAYALEAPCQECNDGALPEVTAQNSVPPKLDLDAYFRVAWDKDFFYVLGEVFDNRIFRDGLSINQNCQNGAACEDAFTVFLDGRNDRLTQPDYRNDDSRIFLAASGKSFRMNAEPLNGGQVTSIVVPNGELCYRVEAQYDWHFITDAQGGGALDNIFPPRNGQEYGFDISINDWDPVLSSEDEFERQSQLFWVSPGIAEYAFRTSGLGAMKLSGDVEPAPPTPQ